MILCNANNPKYFVFSVHFIISAYSPYSSTLKYSEYAERIKNRQKEIFILKMMIDTLKKSTVMRDDLLA